LKARRERDAEIKPGETPQERRERVARKFLEQRLRASDQAHQAFLATLDPRQRQQHQATPENPENLAKTPLPAR
jgi:hypothetical protein